MSGGAAQVDAELAAMLASCGVCRLWAEQDEGPYHREAQPERRDVVEDRDGVELQLGMRLIDDRGEPLPGATVEIWHCDALGQYSGFAPPERPTLVTAETAPRETYLPDQTFLRGRQVTNPAGMVEFRTIYPGWYPGRTVHIHVIVGAEDRIYTSQLYFPESANERVSALSPYAQRPGRDTTNATDAILPTGGDPAILDISFGAARLMAGICLALPESGGSS